jgi:hypothetical protein
VSTDKGPRASTVKVTIHLTRSGQYAVGVIQQEWQGAVRVDRRLARLRPVPVPSAAPPGVDQDVWRAWCALMDVIEEQRTDGLGL